MELLKTTGMSLATDFALEDMPHTISYALLYRSRINSMEEISKDKRPPRNLWDKPYRLNEFLDEVFKRNDSNEDEDYKTYIDISDEELE